MTRRATPPLVPVLIFAAMLIVGALGSAALLAQDPFGGEAAPMPKAPAGKGKKDDEEKKPAGPPPTSDIVVQSLRESNPTTPEQLVSAAQRMADYGDVTEARRYLAQLIAAKPNVGVMAQLQRKFGSDLFLVFLTDKRLAPEGLKVGQAVLQSARTVNDDPARLRALAKQTGAADAIAREEAMLDLKSVGSVAVAPLVEILANRNLPEAQGRARDALVAMGDSAIEPLIGVLETNDHELKVQVIAALTRLKASRVIPYLLRPAYDENEQPKVQAIARAALERLTGSVPSKFEVEAYLARKATEYFDGNWPLPPDPDNIVTLWHWNNAKNASVPHYYPSSMLTIVSPELQMPDGQRRKIEPVPASVIMAASTARDLYTLFPQSTEYKRLFLATHLQAGKLMGGLGNPLPTGPSSVRSMAQTVGAATIEDVLTWSIKHEHWPAAIAAAELLGDTKDPGLLSTASGDVRPLTLALRHPDRRLRFAAVDSIMRLNATTSFPGASFVPETLGYFAGTVGSKRVLIVEPRTNDARTLGGLFSQLGYEADTATTGKEGIALALQQPDYEVILLGDGISFPVVNETWQQLRKDPRTAHLLVCFLASEENLVPLLEKSETDPLARAMPYPHTPDTLAFQLQQL
ncbi:MAG TPA: hypothetical protein VL096_09295, partial [Pirellulaceae bacterium]|nr:hypothetical protein [Pirellulaceae bacterium]